MVRVLLAGLPGRSARDLRDAGHEIVLVDPGVSAAGLAAIAVQEDVAAIALGSGSVDLVGGELPAALVAHEGDGIVVLAVD